MCIHHLFAVQDLGHVDTVLRAVLFRDCPQMRFIGIAHMSIDHIQMPFADRHIAGLDNDKAGMMQAGQHLNQFDQLDKAVQIVLDNGLRTKDIMSKSMKEVSTSAMGDAIINQLK